MVANSVETRDLLESMLVNMGIDMVEWEAGRDADLKALEKNGFIEVEDGAIKDISGLLSRYKNNIHDYEEIRDRLSYIPAMPSQPDGYELIGVEPAGAVTDKGYGGMVSVMSSPQGHISIYEENLSGTENYTVVEPGFLNIKIGPHDASLVVYKNPSHQRVSSEIFWSDDVARREYTVTINQDLNASENEDARGSLLNYLTVNYGEN